jgi:dTDP-4-amino-4,6-dideoxygalactose transaminase
MILMNDFKAEPKELRNAMSVAVNRVLSSGWYVLGKELEEFEQQWADVCGVGYGVGVGNGMDAIEISLCALGIGAGDEVITTSMTAFATVLAIIRSGATPVLADIDPTTALLDPLSVQRCLSAKTKALVLVHLYGQIRNMDKWEALCQENNIALVEDCAQAHMASWQGRRAGSFGSAGAYSFYPTKNLGALGDGGMLVTDDAELANKARCLRNYGQSERYYHPEIGMNSRLDEIQAAILSERLKWLDDFTERRQEIAIAYRNRINNPQISLFATPVETAAHVYHLFVITCEKRDGLQNHLHSKGVQTLIHYPVPIHMQPPCINIAQDSAGLTNSEQHASTCLSLPCHPQLSDNDVTLIIEAVNSF